MQPPRQHEVRLVITRKLRPPHTPRPGGRRFPPPRFRSASPPPASPPTPRRKDAPRPGLRHHVRASHHASGPPRFPSRRSGNCASGTSNMSSTSAARAATSGRYGVKCCPRHSRRFRAPIVACAAWSFLRDHLTPRPAVAKSTYRFCVRKIRCSPALQNICTGAGESPRFLGCRAKSAGQACFGPSSVSRVSSWPQSAVSINPSHPPPLAAAARGVAK